MNIWCPNCGGTQFYYDKRGEQSSPDSDDTLVSDHMKCKNKSCNFEFHILWYSYVREEWIRLLAETKFKQYRKRNDMRDNKYDAHQRFSR